ncbi:signal peptidase I [Curtobacterium herbarum]|uniref:Signal peptidase I n=1 Tax=Curtobacterium herbarum TaxID=150122 RepID=A0ABP4KBR0_9MICO|nr:signal peptidase I [Curtobacterium herbarum]MBM7474900.1 signal peptidase I [Curtobacterium herbarum]MCS6545547.1 signal peptidase I [Curtobacterium herbarum]
MTITASHTAPRTPSLHRVGQVFSKITWAALAVLAVLVVGLAAAQASGVLTLDRILTGSMEPTLLTGDYVLSRGPSGHDLHRGAIIAYSNPAAYDGLRITHRVHSVTTGRAVMQGDHNPGPDPYRIAESDVRGVIVGHIGGFGARIVEQFVVTPQWRTDLGSLIHDHDTAAVPALLGGAPWGLVAALVLMALTALLDRFVLRPRGE